MLEGEYYLGESAEQKTRSITSNAIKTFSFHLIARGMGKLTNKWSFLKEINNVAEANQNRINKNTKISNEYFNYVYWAE